MTALNASLSWPVFGSEPDFRSELQGFRIDAFLGLAPAEPLSRNATARTLPTGLRDRLQAPAASAEAPSAAAVTSEHLDALIGVSEFPEIPADRRWIGWLICLATAAGSAALLVTGITRLIS